MQYCIGLFGIGVKFEKEEFHAHLKNGWNATKKLTQEVKEKAKPAVLSAADKTLKYSVLGLRQAVEGVSIAADAIQDLREQVKKKTIKVHGVSIDTNKWVA